MLGFHLDSIWGTLRTYLGKKWAVMLVVFAIFFALITNADGLLVELINLFAAYVFPTFDLSVPTGAWTALAIANTFFPVAEFFAMLVVYVGVVTTMTIYRHVKSYVPGVFSGGT